ncbi:hypothetical protein K9U39_00090 [Rhodoblastus acidophilus]|uniref:Capsular polysaccharide transport system permease protein n=1 Tax=Candidatus Rhodoblastus alkanivorans TaxID=2954117 RepID=A0ABS9Z375_9HYPH|nr:hypothetical protein [Candidatus Rhodoblastus alkanivorans]MCI4677323.1 hypothetical protein [Candidatus Rhodoblastus alkanivorans]MCI4682058.1 hypothetical protein [Candidatus Rhodoblastus alkanivorans]MDI4639360.1 hypothetical protein [Rhodoblastus acidophilus]
MSIKIKDKAADFADLRNDFDLHEITLTPLVQKTDIIVDADAPAVAETAPSLWTRFAPYRLFVSIVVIPCALAAIYLFVIASDRYLSEAQFIVRSASDSGAATATALIESNGLSRAHDETYVVNAYINSRDAMDWLIRNAGLRQVFSRPEADFINRFPNSFTRDNLENYFEYYKNMVESEPDEETGISTVSVVAFTPQDAQQVAKGLLRAAEILVNNMNMRAEADAVTDADAVVEEARRGLGEIERKLAQFRSRAGFVSAQQEDVAALKTVTSLMTQLAEAQANLKQSQALTPDNPGIPNLAAKIKAYEAQLNQAKASIAGGRSSIASKTGEFEMLSLEEKIAERALAKAVADREAARQAARRQHLYLQVVVEPNLADQSTYPRRLLYLLLTFVAAEAIYMIVKNLRQFAIEHAL